MIEQVGQGRMLAGLEQTRLAVRRSAGGLIDVLAWALGVIGSTTVLAQTAAWRQARQSARPMRGRSSRRSARKARRSWRWPTRRWPERKAGPSDFALRWQNDFVKAQRGTFVPFTLTVDATPLSQAVGAGVCQGDATAGSVSGPAASRARTAAGAGAEAAYPVDAIFPGRADAGASRVSDAAGSRISRGFSVAPGEYDVFVVMRERVDPATPRARPEGCGACASRSAFRTFGRAS